ncbi:MAG: hypothetical protein ABJH07_14340 [Sedimentitalea sp.]|uniref:hypothetical protein n=1 Tax=Sedimentitalea sp. TaxID=2048915 RepID=UPI003264C9E3
MKKDDSIWASNPVGSTISVLDCKTGEPLSPETGFNFDGKLGQMQGVAIASNGDVWTVDIGHSQIVHIPKREPSKGYILGPRLEGKPTNGTFKFKNTFGIAINHHDRIWVGDGSSNTVTRCPANDPSKAEDFEVGCGPHGIASDSQANAWVANLVGHPGTAEKLALIKQKIDAEADERQPFLAITCRRLDCKTLTNCLTVQMQLHLTLNHLTRPGLNPSEINYRTP